jgi:hypothetical protein
MAHDAAERFANTAPLPIATTSPMGAVDVRPDPRFDSYAFVLALLND